GTSTLVVTSSTRTTGTQEYAIYYGQSKVAVANSRSITTVANEVSIVGASDNTTVMEYAYDGVGHLLGATGSGESWTYAIGYEYVGGDLVGTPVLGVSGTTHSMQTMTYDTVYGQAKVTETVSDGTTTNRDGSVVQVTSTSENTYDGFGLLIGVESDSVSIGTVVGYTSDENGNDIGTTVVAYTTATSMSTQAIYYGKAAVLTQVSDSRTENSYDAGWSESHMNTTYFNDLYGRVTGAVGSGTTESESYGYEYYDESITTTPPVIVMSNSTGTIDQTYTVRYGQAKVWESDTMVSTTNADGSRVESYTTVEYSYDDFGYLIGAVGSGQSWSDGYGYVYYSADMTSSIGPDIISETTATITQEFEVIWGQAKVLWSRNESYSVTGSFDSHGGIVGDSAVMGVTATGGVISSSTSDVTTTNEYDMNTGLQTGAESAGTSVGLSWGWEDDAAGVLVVSSTSYGSSQQEYAMYYGGAKVLESTSDSTSVNRDGSWSRSDMTTVSRYDADNGYLIEMTGSGNTYGGDIWGGDQPTSSGTVAQVYEVKYGAGRLLESISDMVTTNWDGSTVSSHSSTYYENDAVGRLIHATGSSYSTSNDGWGNITESEQSPIYAIYYGQAKVVESASTSTTENVDGTEATSNMTTWTYYDAYGHVMSGYGEGSSHSMAVGYEYVDENLITDYTITWLSESSSDITQTFVVTGGLLKILSSHS
ncbi:hypothetical protein ACFL1T_05135, partial [Chlamydiota bacterium]